jgi:hypothetical protein
MLEEKTFNIIKDIFYLIPKGKNLIKILISIKGI